MPGGAHRPILVLSEGTPDDSGFVIDQIERYITGR